LPDELGGVSVRIAVAYHLVLVVVLVLGAMHKDELAEWMRHFGAGLVLLACLSAIFGQSKERLYAPSWMIAAYPLVLAALIAGYGVLTQHRLSLVVAAVTLLCWAAASGWQGYLVLRQMIAGLDHIAVSLVLFAVAILISLYKGGILSKWVARYGEALPFDPAASEHPAGIQQEPTK
jgi:hypothetical protein